MKRIFLTLLGISLYTFLSGMNEIAFRHLGIKDGLSDSQVTHITQDSKGFIWFSTPYGLNRYDGYTFKVYTRNSKNPYSLPENSVREVQEDAGGLLWVRTAYLGYVYYNPEKETFHPAAPLLHEKYGIPESPTLMYIDKEKNIWSHSYHGTHFYDIEKQVLMFYPMDEALKAQGVGLSSITEDKNGILFLYTNGNIERVDPDTNEITYRNNFLASTHTHIWYSIYIDTDGDYWIYGNGTLWLYYTAHDRWERLSTRRESHYVLSNNQIRNIIQDRRGRIWIATDHGGINIIDKTLHTVNYIKSDLFDERSILQNSVNTLYCDNNGGVWVGYYKRGISYYNESVFKFSTDHLSDFSRIEDFTADVNNFAEGPDGTLWVGTSNGLISINPQTNERKIYQNIPGENSLSENVIVGLLNTKDGKVWIGTYLNGLIAFDGRTYTHYRHNPDNPNSLANDNVWTMAEDTNGSIWIGTLGSGLQCLDPRTGKFTSLSKPGDGFGTDYVNSICIARDGDIYMATSNGVVIYSPSTKTFERLNGNRSGTQSFSHQNMNDIYEDSRGLLWLATAEGLNIYNRKNDEVILSVNDPGLGSEIIHAIVEDNNKNMWVTTTSSITNVIVNVDPTTGTYSYTSHRYSELDGLQGQQFNSRAILKTAKGEIIAGGIQGVSFFNPEGLKYNSNTPRIEFTGLQLFNEEVKIDSVYNGNRILTRSLSYTPEIKLGYSQNVFSVSFSGMNYILPEKTQYMYMLEGFNEDWMIADANKLTYTNLTPGKYTLKVKAINSDGFSNHEVSELRIVITPPFWASPLAYVLYFLLIVGILLLARRQIQRNERQKYKLVEVEQEAQRKHEIDDMKLRFFTNISHELRTPLTLIISPLENAIKQTADAEQKNRLEMVHRNAMRLLNMVNQLLDFRKSDVKGHQLNPAQGDIVEFVHTISNSFNEYSEKKNVRLIFFSAIKELFMVFDEDKMGKIIMNLLSNAFKFTPEGGRVDVSLDLLPVTGDEPEWFEIKISDTGVGIKDEDKEQIFERFYQVQQKEGPKTSGSGIGLHLVKEFVALHNGTIKVLDNMGKGSVFIITLPVVRVQNAPEVETKPIPEPVEPATATPLTDNSQDPGTKEEATGLPLILIVDDNEDFRLFMRDSLASDYSVEVAADGAKAWEIIPELQPDIIVSDVMMPEIDGNELCRLVKTDIRTSHIPLILLTARSAKEQKLEGLESGADDYITKPFDFDILSLRIKKLLQLRQKRQENFNPQMEIAPSEITITSLDEKLINKAIKYVEDNISRSELSVEELSSVLNMSRVHLYKKMLSITGKTPIEFIRIIRLKRAAQYLRESQQSISEIAYQTGFSNPKYFRKYFKDEFGILPSEYQGRGGR